MALLVSPICARLSYLITLAILLIVHTNKLALDLNVQFYHNAHAYTSKWVIAQLSVLIVLNVINIIIALPKNVFTTAATKIVVFGTELGFIIVAILYLVMFPLENCGSYQVRLRLSWAIVEATVAIILFQIIVKITELYRLRREKKLEERKRKKASQMQAIEVSLLDLL